MYCVQCLLMLLSLSGWLALSFNHNQCFSSWSSSILMNVVVWYDHFWWGCPYLKYWFSCFLIAHTPQLCAWNRSSRPTGLSQLSHISSFSIPRCCCRHERRLNCSIILWISLSSTYTFLLLWSLLPTFASKIIMTSGFWKPASNESDTKDEESATVFNFSSAPLAQQRLLLPICKHKRQILYSVETYGVVVIVGETGSG